MKRRHSATTGRALTCAQRATGTASLLQCGNQALWTDGDLLASRDWFELAYCLSEVDNDGDVMAQAALGLGGLWVHEQRGVAASAKLTTRLRQALAYVDPRSTLGLRLRVRLAAEADYATDEHQRILAVLAEARRSADPVARAEAASLAHHCLLGPGNGPLRRPLADELTASHTGRRNDMLMGMLWRVGDLLLDGDPQALPRLAELQRELDRQDSRAVRYVVSAIEVMLHIRAGRWQEAETLAERSAELGGAAGDADVPGWRGAHLVGIYWYQGKMPLLLPFLRELVNSPTLSAVDNSLLAALAVAEAQAGNMREAAVALARLCGSDLAALPRSSSWLIAMYGIVEAAHLLGDRETALSAYRLLHPWATLPMMASIGIACFGSTQHALGVASLTLGDPKRAAEHLRAAVRDNERLGHHPAAELSRQRLEQADALLRETSADRPVTCRRRGKLWRFEWSTRTAEVEHSVGMEYLAQLLANPGDEITAKHLAAGPSTEPATVPASEQPLLDRQAWQAYQARLSALEGQTSTTARAEREWLLAELGTASGLGGRARHFADEGERARIAVTKAIRRAIQRVSRADAVIGGELSLSVRTGLRCCYVPGSRT